MLFCVYAVRWCFVLIGENLLSFIWLLPLLILLCIILALSGLKILSEFFEGY
jgi:hypothetical protein